jgi:hypothetical protein
MARCNKTEHLEVHRRRRDQANDLGNAEVLCPECYAASAAFRKPAAGWPDFSEETKQIALSLAGRRCECTGKCHSRDAGSAVREQAAGAHTS